MSGLDGKVHRSTWATRGYITVACLLSVAGPVFLFVRFCHFSCLVVGIAQILILSLRAHRYRLPLPSAHPYPSRVRSCPSPGPCLVWLQSQSISNPLDCISLTPSSSRRPTPRLLSPMRQSSNTFETDPGKRHQTLSNNLPSSQAFSRPTTTEVTLAPGSVDQLALVFLQSCRLLRSG